MLALRTFYQNQFRMFFSRSRVSVDVGNFVKTAVAHEVIQLLVDDAEHCLDNSGNAFNYSDYDDCIYKEMESLMLEDVGCTVPWIPNKSNICGYTRTRNTII